MNISTLNKVTGLAVEGNKDLQNLTGLIFRNALLV